MYADEINPQMEMTVKTSVRGAVAIVMPIPPAPETKAAYHKVSPPDSKNNTKSIIGASRHAVVLSPDAIAMASGLKKKTEKKSEGSLPVTFSMTSTYPHDPLFEIYTLV